MNSIGELKMLLGKTESVIKKADTQFGCVECPLKLSKDKFQLFQENLKETVIKAIAKMSDKKGKDAVVFALEENSNYLLRVDHNVINNVDKLGKDLIAIPIKYDSKTYSNTRLGLPLYLITEKNTLPKGKTFLTPLEAMQKKDKILILRKMKGESPSNPYFEELKDLCGKKKLPNDKYHHRTQESNFQELLNTIQNNTAEEFLECCEKGSYKINIGTKENPIYSEFEDVEKFYDSYKKFTAKYLQSIGEIAELPQTAFDEAVKTIGSARDFRLDFEHPLNIFVDLKNKSFNFFDFEFNPKNFQQFDYKNPVEAFENVLLGNNGVHGAGAPWKLLVKNEDKALFAKFSEIINSKLKSAKENYTSL